MEPNFWKGKRVLITGHTGFQGSWLSLWLQVLGAIPIGYSLPPPTQPNLFELATVAKGMISLGGDVRDLSKLQVVLEEHRPAILIHLAAQSLVGVSFQKPWETFSTNVMGTATVLEAARSCPSLKAVLCATSDKCYENIGERRAFRENDRLGGDDPYSGSKAGAEWVIAAYRHSYFMGSESLPSIASARAGNVIGGGDWAADRLVPDMIRALLGNTAVSLRNPQGIRPWQFVLEPLNGYLILIEKLCLEGAAFAGAWNFGPSVGQTQTVSWIAERLISLWGSGMLCSQNAGSNPFPEAPFLELDVSKAHRRLGWRVLLPLELGLEWTVEWYRAYSKGQSIREITLKQIESFQNRTQ